MSDVPKCTSWLGHSFEARHSLITPPGAMEMIAKVHADSGAPAKTSVDVKFDRHYEGDICVRCGHRVDRLISNERAVE